MTCADCPKRDTCTEICEAVEKLLPGPHAGTNNNERDLRDLIMRRSETHTILDFENSVLLSQGQRQIINLYYRRNLDTYTIAQMLGITPQAVSDRICKMRARVSKVVMER